MDTEEVFINAIREGIREGVKSKLSSGYNSPLDGLVLDALKKHDGALRSMLYEGVNSAVNNEDFRKEIAVEVRRQMAKTLVQRFGGELEKQVNALKSDPSTRARITIALEEIVKERTESA